MIYSELFLPSDGNLPFYARLYHNITSPFVRAPQHHAHAACEIGYFPDFEGKCLVEGAEIFIKPGDIFVFRSNEQHFFTEIISDHSSYTNSIQFYPELFWSNSDPSFNVNYNKIFSMKNTAFLNRLDGSQTRASQIRELFDLIMYEFNTKEPDYVLMIKQYLMNILVLICRQYDPCVVASIYPGIKISKENLLHIQDAIEYIDAHLTEELTLSKLSSVANMSPTYFSQLFKELNGFSTWDYILSKRVAMAQHLLFNTDKPVYEIAYQCGFNNTTNFYKAFKRHTTRTPTYFRMQRSLYYAEGK